MITERYSKINSIISGHSTRLREKYFSNNYSGIYSEINNFCQEIADLSFVQKIWHWVNNQPNYFICKCGKRTSFHKNWLNGYRIHCSAKCSQSEEQTKEKRKKTNIAKYGVDNIAKLDSVKEKQERTNLKKWGKVSSAQNESVKNKSKETIKNKWGKEWYFQTDDFKIKAKKYYLEKYGVEYTYDNCRIGK